MSTMPVIEWIGRALVEHINFLKIASFRDFSRNKISVALVTTEAELVAAGACCAQVLWMKHTLIDYNLHYDHIKIFCDNTSTIHMIKNANQHSKTKHIVIQYYFLRYHYEKEDIEIDYDFTDFQLADIFTKPLKYNIFSFICGELNVCILDS